MTAKLPALLGGTPAFPDGLRLLRPALPPLTALQPGLAQAFSSGVVTKGPALAEYERRLAALLGVKHALGVSSCTAGLMLVLDRFRPLRAARPADEASPQPAADPVRDEVIMPSFTFMATAMAAAWAGLRPVFCDVDRETWSLDPRRAEEAITERTAAIVPVHVFGAPADTEAFATIGERHGVPIVYDAAHGFGALRAGRPLGRDGLAQVFSTSPTKLLITGEGGVVATDDDALAERIVIGREYGNPGTYDPIFPGLNARLPEASALMGLAGLDLLEEQAQRRNYLAALYRESLSALPGLRFQRLRPEDRSSFKDFTVRVSATEFGLTRDELVAGLQAEGIATRMYYVPPVHRTQAFATIGRRFDELLPETLTLCQEVVSLPLYGPMSDAEVERVARSVAALQQYAPRVRAALA